MNPESPLLTSNNAGSLAKLWKGCGVKSFTNQTVPHISTSNWTYAATRMRVHIHLMITRSTLLCIPIFQLENYDCHFGTKMKHMKFPEGAGASRVGTAFLQRGALRSQRALLLSAPNTPALNAISLREGTRTPPAMTVAQWPEMLYQMLWESLFWLSFTGIMNSAGLQSSCHQLPDKSVNTSCDQVRLRDWNSGFEKGILQATLENMEKVQYSLSSTTAVAFL